MIEYVAIGCLTALLIVEKVCHYRERRELCDRIMSNSLAEFKKGEGGVKIASPSVSAHDKVMKEWRGK